MEHFIDTCDLVFFLTTCASLTTLDGGRYAHCKAIKDLARGDSQTYALGIQRTTLEDLEKKCEKRKRKKPFNTLNSPPKLIRFTYAILAVIWENVSIK